MAKFRCKKCDFVFQLEADPRLCPNCGAESDIDREQSADELIKGV
jgi:rubrerythrin